MFTALLSVPAITHSPLHWLDADMCTLPQISPIKKWVNEGHFLLALAVNKSRVKKLVVVCEIALHKSRKCGPTWLCYKMRACAVSYSSFLCIDAMMKSLCVTQIWAINKIYIITAILMLTQLKEAYLFQIDLRDDPKTIAKLNDMKEKPIATEQGQKLAKEVCMPN